ncbi:bifunctional acetate--CoA ligase family protein/GNAT family N-acetyltransferase [Variovorax ureilyticus]|uniref:Bifunctional acetate--CoA ligase family protein/GNAT family N-acetyltransferase n=1 Tax=Variovorax ureilyticus TaxID=1836198 RepID=A0ABU8VGM7_9BURK
MDKHYLAPLLAPRSIVVFASPAGKAAPGSASQALREALTATRFAGTLHFLDIETSGTLADLAQTRADLAIIALPAAEIEAALEVAGRIRCRAALVVSSGVGADQAASLRRIARRDGIQLLGPNSAGFQRPSLQLDASVAGPLAKPGPLALAAQSGALTASMLDWARQNEVGFSSVVSLGPHTCVDIAQVLDFFADDGASQSIIVHLEGISNARQFMSALRSASHAKPVIVLKAGRKPAGNEAAHTHSASIVGSDEVFDAALRRAGAVRVRSFVELFSAAKCLASRYRPVGRRLAIVSNGGGPGVLAADWVNEIGLQLGKLSAASRLRLQSRVPANASLADVIDLSEEAQPAHFRAAIDATLEDPEIAGVLVIFSPKTGCEPVAIAQAVAAIPQPISKPLLACWMGDASVSAGRTLLAQAGIPSFRTPEAAVGAFGNIATFYRNQQLLQQTPPPLSPLAKPDVEGARLLIESVLSERRQVLTEMESKALLSSFHIPITRTLLARSANEAMMIATQLGFPVALKIDSPDIAHKSDVDGVALNVMNAAGARDTYLSIVERVSQLDPHARINGVTVQPMVRARRGREVHVGVVTDDPFGPVIVFGAGGTMIELVDDRAMELPPLNQFLARSLIERSRVAETLGEWRGADAADLEALEQVLLRVSEMVCELPELREMDINPIIADESGCVAVDARIVIGRTRSPIGGAGTDYQHLAILPYPSRYRREWPLRNGTNCTVRPVHPDDAQMLQAMVQQLSPESRWFRFVSRFQELPPVMLSRFTLIDYDREMALVAVVRERIASSEGASADRERIVAVSRYFTNPDRSTCEFSLVVADDYKGQGLGSRLLESIIEVARDKGLAEIQGLVLSENAEMLKLVRRLGFTIKPFPDDPEFRLVTHAL